MSKFARKNVRKLKAYVPGEQPRAGAKTIKLNTNENPYPPCPKVRQALRRFGSGIWRRYPEPQADTFRHAAARVLGVRPEMIIAGNGSDDIINIAIRTFVEPGERIAYPVPTYSLYPVLSQIQQARIVEVPFGPDFDLPDQLSKVNAKLTFLANPNAPSGTFIQPTTIARLARAIRGLLVVDEAYVDFVEDKGKDKGKDKDNCLDLVKRHANVIVMRTLSKSYSLAGLRFGFAIAQSPLIDDMLKVKDSYNCDTLAITLAAKAIEDQQYLKKTVTRICRGRTWLSEQLAKLGFTVLPSQANFVWATIASPPAGQIYLQLKRRGILVRYFDQPTLKNGLRITVDLPRNNQALIEALRRILDKRDN